MALGSVMVTSGVYQIENQANGNCYVGSALNLRRRWSQHLTRLRHNGHCNQHLQRAFDKYGENAFAFSVLQAVEDRGQLIAREQHFIDIVQPEYNIAPVAGSALGRPCSPETRRKLSEALSGERHPNYGRAFSEAHCRNLAEAQKGRPCTAEMRKKISDSLKGQAFSEERRAKISEALRGERNPNYGKCLTEEHRRNISIAQKARWRRVRAEHQDDEPL